MPDPALNQPGRWHPRRVSRGSDKMPLKDRERRLRYWREYHKRVPDGRIGTPERRAQHRDYRIHNVTKVRAYQSGRDEELRTQTFAAYGGPECRCCGESIREFLVIDHIDGGGNKHRTEVGGGLAFYRWLRKNGFPDGYQVLCLNCNWGKFINHGVCPHRKLEVIAA